MKHIDRFLLHRAQKVSDSLQEWIGITNFDIARIWLLFAILARVLEEALNPKHGGIFDIMLFSLVFFYFVYILMKAEKRNNYDSFRNELESQLYLLRSFLSILLTTSIVMVLLDLKIDEEDRYINYPLIHLERNLFEFLFLYFVSCTPKPHTPIRIKRWLSSISRRIALAI